MGDFVIKCTKRYCPNKIVGSGYKPEPAREWGMKEHVNLLKEQGLPIPPKNQNPKIIIQNEDVLITA